MLASRFGRQVVVPILLGILTALVSGVHAQGNAQKGLYVSAAAGCVGCHTDSKTGAVPYAGGRALETPFGVFYGPNLTPDKDTGLGNWSEADFKRALRHGERPDGANYFPAFPYPSFTGMSDADISDLWAYMRSLPPTKKANREHDLKFPYNLRVLVSGWKMLYFTPGQGGATPSASDPIARGAYLVRALGHCGECHTPRDMMGGIKTDAWLAGTRMPKGKMPNITPTRLKKWKDSDLREYFATGNAPSGDLALDPMSEVITNTTSKWTKEDVDAVIAYLRSVAPQPEPK
jgi:mono/diheme cytochrome c family protein